jgi:hypothetical protein
MKTRKEKEKILNELKGYRPEGINNSPI